MSASLSLRNIAPHAAILASFAAGAFQECSAQEAARAPIARPAVTPLDSVIATVSSSEFRTASALRQLSVLGALKVARVFSGVDQLDSARRLVEQLEEVCSSLTYLSLSETDRNAVISLAILQVPAFSRLFLDSESGSSIPGATRRVFKDSGAALLARLEGVAHCTETRLLTSGGNVVRQILTLVASPDAIRQNGPTCFSTVLVRHLARTQPGEFIRLSLDLVEHGEAKTQSGLLLSLNSKWIERYRIGAFGFPIAQVLPWALYQTLHGRTIDEPFATQGVGELLVGVDVARFFGRNVDLRTNYGRAPWKMAEGDILFLTPNAEHLGHVLQVERFDGRSVCLYDPDSGRGIGRLLRERLRPEDAKLVEVDHGFVTLPVRLLGELIASSYQVYDVEPGIPSFGIVRTETQTRRFEEKQQLQSFVDRERARYGERMPWGSLPFAILFSGMTAVAAYRLLKSTRDVKQEDSQDQTQ